MLSEDEARTILVCCFTLALAIVVSSNVIRTLATLTQ